LTGIIDMYRCIKFEVDTNYGFPYIKAKERCGQTEGQMNNINM